MPYSVAVAGATGYAGGEVLRILAQHPDFEVNTVTARSTVGAQMGNLMPHIPPLAHLTVQETTAENLNGHDVIFLALPHGASGTLASQLDPHSVVVDLGADHRLENKADWDAFYGGQFFDPWVYGMPELIVGTNLDGTYAKQRDQLRGARRIAGPGCNVTATTLALQPGLAAGLVASKDVVATLVVGYSGAGKSLKNPSLLAAEAMDSAHAYGVGGTHRHIPEILQNFVHARAASGASTQAPTSLSFTPVLAPMARGIFATVTAKLTAKALSMDDDAIRAAWVAAYKNEHFMQLLGNGTIPATGNVVGSNSAHLQVVVDRSANRINAMCAIDNLNRGTAGQAIQALNIALGIKESQGLTTIGVAP